MPTARIDARIRVNLPVVLADDTVHGTTVDLSVSGMGLHIPEPADLSERTDFRLLLPTGHVVQGECRVLRRDRPGHWGVVFSHVLPLDIAHLRLYLYESLGQQLHLETASWRR
jgi:hypothetical protein